MKILLDENLDRRLRTSIGPHDTFTIRYMGWTGLKNGNLLDAAEEDRIDLLLTGDRTLHYEQNLAVRKLAVISLSSAEWRILKDHLDQIIAAIDRVTPGSFQAVDCGTFSRKKRVEGIVD